MRVLGALLGIVFLLLFSLNVYNSYDKIHSVYEEQVTISPHYLKYLSEKKDDPTGRLAYYVANVFFSGCQNSLLTRDQAISLLKSSAEKGYSGACIHLARLYLANDLTVEEAEGAQNGKSGELQKREALKWLRLAAEDGSARACYVLASTFPDDAKAMDCLKKSAGAGYGPALLMLGREYAEGLRLGKNPEEAVSCFEKAYAAGMQEAGFRLAECCLDGIGTARDVQKAGNLLLDLARSGHTGARDLLLKLHDEKLVSLEPGSGVNIWESEFPRWPNREKLNDIAAFFSDSMKMVCAARDGRWDEVFALLDRGHADINARATTGRTALYYAAQQRNGEIAHALLERGASPNVGDAFQKALSVNHTYRGSQSQHFPMNHDMVMDMVDHGAICWEIRPLLAYHDRQLLQLADEKWDIINPDNFGAVLETKDRELISFFVSAIEKPIPEYAFMNYVREIGENAENVESETLESFVRLGDHIKSPEKEKFIQLTREHIASMKAWLKKMGMENGYVARVGENDPEYYELKYKYVSEALKMGIY